MDADRKIYNRKYYLKSNESIKDQHKLYYEGNKEQILERCEKYRLKNLERIQSKHLCPCGGRYTLCHKSTHFATEKHKTFLKRGRPPDPPTSNSKEQTETNKE